ncbi:MAG: hypothetical protein ACOH5I_21280 [Oligoflexus sp.]
MSIFGEPWKKIRRLGKLSHRLGKLDEYEGISTKSVLTGNEAWDYELLDDPKLSQKIFARLVELVRRELCVTASSPGGSRLAPWLCEKGQIPDGGKYFYVQPWNEEGWLFESASAGWTVARATKIVHEQRFLRHRESWEAATLLQPRQREALIRVSSNRYGDDPICLPIYEDFLLADFRRVRAAVQVMP